MIHTLNMRATSRELQLARTRAHREPRSAKTWLLALLAAILTLPAPTIAQSSNESVEAGASTDEIPTVDEVTVDQAISKTPTEVAPWSEPSVQARITEARQVIIDNDASAEAWGRLATLYMVHGRGNEALECFDAAAERDAADMRWPYLKSLTLARVDADAAIAAMNDAIKLDPAYVPARVHRARMLAETGDLTTALAEYERAMQLAPDSWHLQVAAAQVSQALGDLELALHLLNKADAIAPNQRLVQANLAHLYEALNDEQASRAALLAARMLPASPPFADPILEAALAERADFVRMGLEYARSGNIRQAADAWAMALDAVPDSAMPAVYLADAMLELNRREDAMRYASLARESGVDEPQLVLRLADVFRRLGRADTAVVLLDPLAEANPDDASVLLGLGIAFRDQGRLDAAVEKLRQCIEAAPKSEPAWIALIEIALQTGQSQQALEWSRQSLEHVSRAAVLYILQGTALEHLGRHGEAIAAFERGVQVAPTDAGALSALCWALLTSNDKSRRDPARALELAERSAELSSDSVVTRTNHALALLANDHAEEAISAARAALDLRPADPIAKTVLSIALAGTGSIDDARRVLGEVQTSLQDRPDVPPILAELLQQARRATKNSTDDASSP